jgi:hypothetical protein
MTPDDAIEQCLSRMFWTFRDRLMLLGNYGEFTDKGILKSLRNDLIEDLADRGFAVSPIVCSECNQPNGGHVGDCLAIN